VWQFRTAASKSLVEYARERLSRQLTASGASPEAIDEAKHLFDPNALTLGFARRFATYKRPNLLLHDRERLLRLLSNSQRPVQLIIAGKAHPADQAGQALIQEWIHFIRQSETRPHVIFLSDYDMNLTEQLVQGPSRGCVFHATLPATRPASDYTARAIPHRSGVAVPLESARILWQR
jgi:starch phosphorylase